MERVERVIGNGIGVSNRVANGNGVGARAGIGVGVIVFAAVLAGCSSGSPAGPPAARTSAPASSPAAPAATGMTNPARSALAARYLAIATAGNSRLEVDFDRLKGPDAGSLVASAADLRDVAATERLFDQRLAAITFPPPVDAITRTLFAVNESRASLTTTASAAPTLAQLHGYDGRLSAANVPVEEAVTAIRSRLGLPPPETS